MRFRRSAGGPHTRCPGALLPRVARLFHTRTSRPHSTGCSPGCGASWPILADLIRELEGDYQRALMEGDPAYDPSWMWSMLELIDRSEPMHPPPLAERLASMAPGLDELCGSVPEHLRRQPGFDDASAVFPAENMWR